MNHSLDHTTRPTEERLALSEVVSALSFALDLTEDADPGHALRACLIGMRIGVALGLSDAQLHDLYYALLLKDVGCSSNSARMCQILGADDRKAKSASKLVDWSGSKLEGIRWAWTNALPEANFIQRALRLGRMGLRGDRDTSGMIQMRCERGADIVRKIGLSEACADAIHGLDEHWDGLGYPDHLRGDAAPMLGRILGVAQHLDVFAGEAGTCRAIETLKERSGKWFDPNLVRIASTLHREGTLWHGCRTLDERRQVLDLEPGVVRILDEGQIDQVCEAFADVVDAKSPFTYRHSIGVMEAATGIAQRMGLSAARSTLVHRASLLHDIGKLGVSNSILDKPGKLDAAEWLVVRRHPEMSERILERIPSFAAIARIAGNHHEKLDGAGYPNGLRAGDLSLEDRIVTLADMYGALAEDRPYRPGMPAERIISILSSEVPGKLDATCYEALLSYMAEAASTRASATVRALPPLLAQPLGEPFGPLPASAF